MKIAKKIIFLLLAGLCSLQIFAQENLTIEQPVDENKEKTSLMLSSNYVSSFTILEEQIV